MQGVRYEKNNVFNAHQDNQSSVRVLDFIMDQIKQMFSRLKNRNQSLLTDGKESEEKKGLFSKLFGKKEKVMKVYIDVNEVINGKEEKQIKSTFDSYIYENKDTNYDFIINLFLFNF